jgi:magnesium transporter
MQKKKSKGAAEWLDFQRPTAKELEPLRKRFGFHDVILQEVLGPSARSRVETYDDYLFLVYYFPVYDPKEQTSHRAEVDFLITRDAVITTHYEPIEALKGIKGLQKENSLHLLYEILETLCRFEERQLHHVREKVEAVGNELFRDKEQEILSKISLVKRDISEYRLIVRSGESVLNSLRDRGLAFWGEDARVYLNDLAGDHLRIINQIEDFRQTVVDFENTNVQIMNVKTNQVMKRFTAMSFLTFPFVLFVALFDMHLMGNPLNGMPGAFWVAFGGVFIGIVTLASYFKRRDWL